MSSRVLRVLASASTLDDGIAAIQAEQKLDVTFPPEVEAAAEQAGTAPALPDRDRTDLPFLTIDPLGSMDLDQAMHFERDGDGFVVHYAIADVAAFVPAGGPIDTEARKRGESLYGADSKVPLHPTALSEGAASLLPDQVRPAFLWSIRLDARGETVEAKVERARVRSVARLDYVEAQKILDGGAAANPSAAVLGLLKEVGLLRLEREADRGGVNLPMPEQEIDCSTTPWRLEFRAMLPIESWNAQISLLTGFAAAKIMLDGKVGVLRTLPPAPDEAVSRLRRTARALGIDWPAEQGYAAFIRALDPDKPAHLAMVTASTSLLRGAAYAAFDGSVPDQPLHAALASPYAHVTAPLRRLVDRFGLEVCAALCAGREVPSWARAALPDLPELMQASGHRAHAYENAVLNLVEAATLAGRVGETFDGVVVDADRDDARHGDVLIREPAVTAHVSGTRPVPVGDALTVTLAEADVATRTVRFTAP